MSVCGQITQGAIFDCDFPIAPGVDERLILVNKDDWDEAVITYDVTDSFIITNAVLPTGKQGWAFEGNRQSNNPQYNMIPTTVSIGYDHQVDFLVFDISAIQKENLEKMALGKMVAVVENNRGKGNGENYFEVYGVEVGVEVITLSRIPSDAETAGAFSLSLKTSDNAGKEPKMPPTWFDTDYNTTKALVDLLLIPAA